MQYLNNHRIVCLWLSNPGDPQALDRVYRILTE
jgi:hypothetical protein